WRRRPGPALAPGAAAPGRVGGPAPGPGARHGRPGNCATGGGAGAGADLGDADAAPVHGTEEITVRAVDVVVHARQRRAPNESVPDAGGAARVGTAVYRDGIGSRVLVRHDAPLRSGVRVSTEQLPSVVDGPGDRVPSAGERDRLRRGNVGPRHGDRC